MKYNLLKSISLLGMFAFAISVNAQTAEVLETLLFQNVSTGAQTNKVFSYDLNGNIVSELETAYNTATELWENYQEITYSHTEDQIVKTKKEWDASLPAWENKDRWTYVQNELGDDIVKEFVVWNGSEYVNSQRNEIVYNSQGQRIESIFLQHDQFGGWTENYKYTYSYDANGSTSLAFRYNYDFSTESYIPYKRWSFSNNQDGLTLSRTESNYEDGSWSNYKKNVYTYNDSQLQSIRYEIRDANDTQWLASEERQYTYNEQGNITTMDFLDSPSNPYADPLYRFNYGYEGLSADLVILPYYFDEGYRNDHYQDEKLVSSDYYYRNPGSGLLEQVTGETRTYSILDGFVGVEDILSETINVYPNPTTGILQLPETITANYVSVYNMAGLLTKQILKLNDSQLDVSSLTSGNYILKFQTKDGTFISKFQKL